jgi:hypothetical protein
MAEPIEIRISLVLRLVNDTWTVEASANANQQYRIEDGVGTCQYCGWKSTSDQRINQRRGLAAHMRQIHPLEWRKRLQNGKD